MDFLRRVLRRFSGGNFRCEVLDWHKPSKRWGWDGCSFTSACAHCGKCLLRDSQSNWF